MSIGHNYGLAEPKANPGHKRAPIFVATEAGERRSAQVQQAAIQLADSLADQFDDARAAAILSELRALLAEITARNRARGED